MKFDEQTPGRVLEVMKTKAGGWFVLDLIKAAEMGPGEVYPALASLEAQGKVSSEWARPEGPGPRRRLYSVAGGNKAMVRPGPGVAVHPDCGHPDWPDCPHYR